MRLSVQVLAKPPLPGRVKTRLAGVLGRHGCARLARAQLERTLAVAASADIGPVTLRLAGGPWHPFCRECARRHGADLGAQLGPDLGARMANAARRGSADCDGVVLLGTDCPGLEPGDLRAAARYLGAGADVVLGPAHDGGYYLAALARPVPVMFRAMDWGGADVTRQTLRRLRAGRYRVALIQVRRDLDRPSDLPGSPFRSGPGRLAQGLE